jgi:hypothetical protein
MDGEIAASQDAAGQILDADLLTVRTVFDNIDQTYERINGFRVRLEARLGNTIRYAEFGDQRHSRRLADLVVRLDQACTELAETDPAWLRREQPRTMMVTPTLPWAPMLLAEPRGPRQPVPTGLLRRQQADPVLARWRLLLRQYNDLFIDDIRRVHRFLETRIPPGSTGEARFLHIETIEDFLAFDHLRRLRRDPPATLRQHFDIDPCPGDAWRDDDWVNCENFIIRRKTGHLTLAAQQA